MPLTVRCWPASDGKRWLRPEPGRAAGAVGIHLDQGPAFPDTYYLGKVAAPDAINTIPERRLAFADHGVDINALAESLQRQGATAFEAGWTALVDAIAAKAKEARKRVVGTAAPAPGNSDDGGSDSGC
jgi:hypothetical protein